MSHIACEAYQADCTCDGDWLHRYLVDRASPAILAAAGRKAGPHRYPLRLQIDNAGGHGGKAKIQVIRAELLELGIDLVCQPANSPEMNVLDLGVWLGIQAMVEKLGFKKRMCPEVLFRTVEEAWQKYGNEKGGLSGVTSLKNAWCRLVTNADNCIEDKDGNRSVEAKRGYSIHIPADAGYEEGGV